MNAPRPFNPDAAISARGLSKRFSVPASKPGLAGAFRHFFVRKHRTIDAVTGIDFDVEPGCIVGFLGPNGAGKTTALKMLTGLIEPTAGGARVLGHRPFDRDHRWLRRITLVMGNKQQLIWDLPARDSLRINAAVYDIDDHTARHRVAELAEMLDVDEEINQPVRKLSLGQRMKVELLAALLHRPEVLFLDEPTLGLDVSAQMAVRGFLREYNRMTGATILLTSHYMADIEALAGRVLVIDHGALRFDGPLSELVQRHAKKRELHLTFTGEVAQETLAPLGDVVENALGHARIVVDKDRVPAAIERALQTIAVSDLSIADPPLEAVMVKLFEAPPSSS